MQARLDLINLHVAAGNRRAPDRARTTWRCQNPAGCIASLESVMDRSSTSRAIAGPPRRFRSFGSLADLSIRRPVFAWMLMAAAHRLRARSALSRLGVSEQPDVDFPVLTINATWGGSAPE